MKKIFESIKGFGFEFMVAIFAVLLYLIPRTYFKHTLSTRTHGGYGKVAWNGGTTKKTLENVCMAYNLQQQKQ